MRYVLLALALCSVAVAQDDPRVTYLRDGEYEVDSPFTVVVIEEDASASINAGSEFIALNVYGDLLFRDGTASTAQLFPGSNSEFNGGEIGVVLTEGGASQTKIRGGAFRNVRIQDGSTLNVEGGELEFVNLFAGGTLKVDGGEFETVQIGQETQMLQQGGSIDNLLIAENSAAYISGGSIGNLNVGTDQVYFYGKDLQLEVFNEVPDQPGSENRWILRDAKITGTFSDGSAVDVSATLLNDLDVNLQPIVCFATRFGDFNADGISNFADFLIVSENYGTETADPLRGDADCDGRVGFTDYLIVAAIFQGADRVESVPEPNGSLLAFIVLVVLTSGRQCRPRSQQCRPRGQW